MSRGAEAPGTSRAAGIGRNSVINVVGWLVPTVVSLATVPAYLHHIGEARYGMLAIIWVLLGYFAAFDMGLGRTTTNKIAQLRDAPARERSDVVWTAALFNTVLGVVGGLVLLVAGLVLVRSGLRISPSLRQEATSAIPWVAVAVPFVTVSAVLTGALEGLELFGVVNAIEVVVSLVFQLAPLAVAFAVGPNLEWLVAAAALGPVSRTLLGAFACQRRLLLGRPRFAVRYLGSMLRYGGWITVTSLVSPVLTTMDRVVLGALSGAAAVTRYVVPLNLVSRLTIVPYSLCRTLFPRLSSLDESDARGLARDSLRVLTAIITPCIVVGTVVMEPFLHAWVGPKIASASTPVGVILLGGVWCNSLALVPFTLLQGQGRPDMTAKLHVLEVPPYLLSLWLGIHFWGISGVAVAWSLRMLIDGLLLVATSGLRWRVAAEALPGLLLTSAAIVAALVAYADPAPRAAVGGLLIILSLIVSARALPLSLLAIPRRTRRAAPVGAP